MFNLNNKVIVITGAGSGIGQALAVQLAKEGAVLAINDINEDNLRETAQLVADSGARITTHLADVSDRAAVEGFAKEVIDVHGQVDLLINNAGVALGRIPIAEMSWEYWEWIMGINFWGTVYCTRFFLPVLSAQEEAQIVNVSSVFGLGAVKDRAGYCASKFASRGFTETLRQELFGTNVQVSLVLPGGIRTNLAKHARGWKDPLEQKKAARLQKEDNITTSEKAASIIIKGIKKNRPRILIGPDAKLLDIVVRFIPSYYDRLINFFISKAEKKQNKIV